MMVACPDQGRVLALDVGERRVGIAISDPSRTIARPLCTVRHHPRPNHFAEIAHLVSEHHVGLVVVGNPVSLDGTEGAQARRIRRYRLALATALPVPVVDWDERYSTAIATDYARDVHGERARHPDPATGGSRQEPGLDALAAAVILQGYLDACRENREAVTRAEAPGQVFRVSDGDHATTR